MPPWHKFPLYNETENRDRIRYRIHLNKLCHGFESY